MNPLSLRGTIFGTEIGKCQVIAVMRSFLKTRDKVDSGTSKHSRAPSWSILGLQNAKWYKKLESMIMMLSPPFTYKIMGYQAYKL